MAHKLFEDFLIDSDVYRSCQQFWSRLVERVAISMGQADAWQPWIPRHYANGSPVESDGNPIYDGRSKQLDRAYRIIQHPAIGDEIGIAAWIKTYEEEFTELPRHELIISLSLSEESASIAEELLRNWMAPNTTPASMEAFIASHVPDEDGRGGRNVMGS